MLQYLVEEMISRGDKVTVCSFETACRPSVNERIEICNFKPIGPFDYSFACLASIPRFHDFDVIFAQHYYHFSCVFASLIARRYDVPLIVKPIGLYRQDFSLDTIVYRLVESLQGRFVLESATLLLPTTSFEARALISKGLSKQKIKIIPSGVRPLEPVSEQDLRNFRKRFALSVDDKIVLFVGRVEESKGVGMLLKALQPVFEQIPNARCLLVGPLNEHYKSDVTRYSQLYQSKVVFSGPLHDKELSAAYNVSKIFVLPSKTELASLTIREASLAGLPVLATNIGGNPEFVIDGVTGFLFEFGDVANLSRNICKLLNDENLRRKLGLAGAKFALNFSLRSYINQTMSAIDSVV